MSAADWATSFKIDGLDCLLELRFDAAAADTQDPAGKDSAASAEVRQLLALAAEAVAATGAEDAAVRDHEARLELELKEHEQHAWAAVELLQLQVPCLVQFHRPYLRACQGDL